MNIPIDSNLFGAAATLFAGTIAYIVYRLSKDDEKRKAAIVLLNEIRAAEDAIEKIAQKLDSGSNEDYPAVLQVNSWRTFSYLFAGDFDQDEFALLNKFYNTCEIIQDFAARDNGFFWITTEERSRVTQQKLADFIFEGTENYEEKLNRFVNSGYQYSPQKTTNKLKFYVNGVTKISTNSCGVKLKKFARNRFLINSSVLV